MNLADQIAARLGYVKKASHDGALAAALASAMASDAGAVASDPDPSLYYNQADVFRRLSWVYGAVSTVAQSVASLGEFDVFQYDGEKRKAIQNHPLAQLLMRPNPYQFDSRFEFLEAIVGYYKLTGNCYIYANALSPDLPPAELWLLRPDRVQVVPSKTNFVQGYIYDAGDVSITFDAGEIIHLRAFHPINDWYGLSAIESLALAIESDLKQAAWNKNFFGTNNAKPQGGLAFTEQFDDETWRKLKVDIAREFGGTSRQMMLLRGVGAGGVQWLQMGLAQKDMEFLGGRQFTKEEIYTVLAPGLVQMVDKDATEASALAGERTYREYAIYPLLKRIGEKLSARLLPRYGANLFGEFKDVRYRDRRLEIDEQRAYASVHTIDEVREKYYDGVGIGDERGRMLLSQVTQNPHLSSPAGAGDVMIETARQNAQRDAQSRQAAARLDENPADRRQANQDATLGKALERKQFAAYARRCRRESTPEKIVDFEFKALDAEEQKAVGRGQEAREAVRGARRPGESARREHREEKFIAAEPRTLAPPALQRTYYSPRSEAERGCGASVAGTQVLADEKIFGEGILKRWAMTYPIDAIDLAYLLAFVLASVTALRNGIKHKDGVALAYGVSQVFSVVYLLAQFTRQELFANWLRGQIQSVSIIALLTLSVHFANGTVNQSLMRLWTRVFKIWTPTSADKRGHLP